MSLVFLWITLFLMGCVCTDLLYAKVFNNYVLAALSITFCFFIFAFRPENIFDPILSLLLMFALGLALFKFKVLGGGDIKAMLVAVPFLTPEYTLMFITYSLLWGGVFSVIYFLTKGTLGTMVFTTAAVFKKSAYAVHKIPFTVGILLGWLSLYVLGMVQ